MMLCRLFILPLCIKMSLFTSDALARAKLAQCRKKPMHDVCAKNCVKLDSRTNCGKCGNKCAANQACLNGTCSAKPPVWAQYALWPGAPNVSIPASDDYVAQYRQACGAQHRPVREDDATPACLALDKQGLGFSNYTKWQSCGTTQGTQRIVNAPCVPRAIIKHGQPVAYADIYNTERLTPSNVAYYNTCRGFHDARPLFTDEVPKDTAACTYWTVDRPLTADVLGENHRDAACAGKHLIQACMKD
jgi:hypothetical protein